MAAVNIGPLSQIPPGEGRNFEIGGVVVAVFHTRAGQVFATQAACPHKGGPLADGLIDGASVVCPLHDRVFAFATGEGPDCSIAVYPAAVTEAGVLVTISRAPEKFLASR
jgi:nitrite reductase (NADH) small subunit